MPSPLPRQDRAVLGRSSGNRGRHRNRTMAAFPVYTAGQLLRCTFRGLLSVHCTLRPVPSPSVPSTPVGREGSGEFVTSFVASLATGWNDPVAGRDCPAEIERLFFSRRTYTIVPTPPRRRSVTVRAEGVRATKFWRFVSPTNPPPTTQMVRSQPTAPRRFHRAGGASPHDNPVPPGRQPLPRH